jgi:hypothetical protein
MGLRRRLDDQDDGFYRSESVMLVLRWLANEKEDHGDGNQ